jgi:hypothetical protein
MSAKIFLNLSLSDYKGDVNIVVYYVSGDYHIELNYHFVPDAEDIWNSKAGDLHIKSITLEDFKEISNYYTLIDVDVDKSVKRITVDAKNYLRTIKLKELKINKNGQG